jgi:hypothetical protein
MGEIKLEEEKVEQQNTEITPEKVENLIKESALGMLRENFPDIDDIVDSCKENYGEVYLYAFDEKDFCIYRPVKRAEYARIVASVSTELDIEDAIVKNCVIYSSFEISEDTKAGKISMMASLIQYASDFGSNNPVVRL